MEEGIVYEVDAGHVCICFFLFSFPSNMVTNLVARSSYEVAKSVFHMAFVLSIFKSGDNRGRKGPGLISSRVKAEISFDLRDLELLLSYFLTPSRKEIDLYTPGALEATDELRCIQTSVFPLRVPFQSFSSVRDVPSGMHSQSLQPQSSPFRLSHACLPHTIPPNHSRNVTTTLRHLSP
jgi:hypothetical protein